MCCTQKDLFLRKGDFNGSANTYVNKALTGRFRVLLDRHLVLEPKVEWDCLQSGGFVITIAGWQISEDTIIVIQFY